MHPKRTSFFSRTAPVAVFSGILAFAPVAATAAYAQTSSEISSELEAAQNDLYDLSKRLEIAAAKAEETSSQLDETQTRIKTLEGEISQNKDKLAIAQDDLAKTMTASYKDGGTSLVKMLFSNSSFAELISSVHYANRVATSNAEKAEEVNNLLSTLNNQTAELSQKEKELSGLLDEQKTTQADLASSKAAAESYVNGLSSELRAALEAERAARAEKERQQAAANQGNSGNGDVAGGGNAGNSGSGQASDNAGSPTTPSRPDSGNKPSKPDTGGNTGGSGSGGGGNAGSLSTAARNTIISAAKTQLGVPYSLGAMSPGVAMDCSGLTTYSYAQAGISIPRSSRSQYSAVKGKGNLKTSAGQLVPGDLVFYQSGGTVYHVAIYLGGNMVIHANGYGQGVVETGIFYDSGFCGGGSPV